MSTTDGSAAEALREQIEAPEIAVLPGVYDALSAMLAEAAGFEAAFTSGFAVSASLLGVPDLGLLTMAENVDRVRTVAESVSIPLLVDADTGYGNALNVRRTVRECADAGAAGVVLEDQRWPKRCGHMEEKRVVPTEEHARRIRAAADARDERGDGLVIVGRTDAREPLGLAAAVERGHVYREAGADVVFVEAPRSREELSRIAGEFDAPTLSNMVEGGRTPYLPPDELEGLGFDVVLYPVATLFAATRATGDALAALRTEGTTRNVDTTEFHEFEELIGAEAFRARERRYADMYADDGPGDADASAANDE